MAKVLTEQSTTNMDYVRRLLREKQPAFSATLELTVSLLELELRHDRSSRERRAETHAIEVTFSHPVATEHGR